MWLSDFTSLLQGCARNWLKIRPPKQSQTAIWHNTCADSKLLMLSIVRGGGGEGWTGVKNSCLPCHAFPASTRMRLRNIKHCVISPASRLFRTSTSRPLFSPAPATPAHPPLFSRAPPPPPPISSPQMWFGVLASRCNEDHYLISIKQIFVSRIFLCAVINQVNRSFTIDSEAARLKSYLEKKRIILDMWYF